MKSVNETVEKRFGHYPEKVLQFGEGNFLRAFADWMIDLANEDGLFHGSIVLCQPIITGVGDKLDSQDQIYTVAMRGIENGKPVERFHKVTSISRNINPYADYQSYLDMAKSPTLEVIVSNTTEAGIVYHEGDRLEDAPPVSYPAKLCAFLYTRFLEFHGAPEKGLLILPVELIDNNGVVLKELVLRYASEWKLEAAFVDWLNNCNEFTSTLVDRIVTGYPRDSLAEFESKLGYRDCLLDTCELFNLWVIEGDKKWQDRFPIHKTCANVIWTDNVVPYKKRKVRILNGSHTAVVPCAFLAGYDTVLEFFTNSAFGTYERELIDDEILPVLDLPRDDLLSFVADVEERFRNPYIKHRLIDITLNNCSKFKARCLPTMLEYYEKTGNIPSHFAFAFAGFIRFYHMQKVDGCFIGHRDNGEPFEIRDDAEPLEYLFRCWSEPDLQHVIESVACSKLLWDCDLEEKMPGLVQSTLPYLQGMMAQGISKTLAEHFQ